MTVLTTAIRVMKRLFIVFCTIILTNLYLGAQKAPKITYKFTEASELNLVGKIHEGTPNPYHRVDTVKYKGFTEFENQLVRLPAGLAVLFKTNSSVISVKTEYCWETYQLSTMPLSHRGYDLYIKKGDQWLWTAAGATRPEKNDRNLVLIRDMDNNVKECLLYLPIHTEVNSVKIGVEQGAEIEALESPFRYRIGIFGSSFTQGISTSRAGMSYPMQLMRWTGLQFLNLGCRGNCKMQSYFADVLCDAEVDALIFDTFSNPDAKQIEERLFPFIEQIQKTHPDIPLIFQQTIYRERRNFCSSLDKEEREKMEVAEKLMKEACRKYRNVYFIRPNATSSLHETSVDGVHPGDHGYTLWAKSIEKPLLKILRKYGIK